MFKLFNRLCNICGVNAAASPHALCSQCHVDLPWLREFRPVNTSTADCQVRCAFYYEWPVNRLLHLYKFQHDMQALETLLHCKNFLPSPKAAALLPVPVSRQRLAQRGFNQSLLIARKLSKHWHIPLWQGVTRVRHTPHQRLLKRAERQNNLKGAFAVEDSNIPSSLIIVDDVLTTGATITELAHTLYNSRPDIQLEGFALAFRSLMPEDNIQENVNPAVRKS